MNHTSGVQTGGNLGTPVGLGRWHWETGNGAALGPSWSFRTRPDLSPESPTICFRHLAVSPGVLQHSAPTIGPGGNSCLSADSPQLTPLHLSSTLSLPRQTPCQCHNDHGFGTEPASRLTPTSAASPPHRGGEWSGEHGERTIRPKSENCGCRSSSRTWPHCLLSSRG